MMIKGMNTVIVTVIKDTIITALLITKYTILTVSIVVLVVTSALLIINYALLTKRSDRQGQVKALHMIHSVNRAITKARRLY
jgi:sensor domain CHASE-containing protein